MEIGIYGLGRMGGNMATRLAQGGHRVVASNRSKEPNCLAAKFIIGPAKGRAPLAPRDNF